MSNFEWLDIVVYFTFHTCYLNWGPWEFTALCAQFLVFTIIWQYVSIYASFLTLYFGIWTRDVRMESWFETIIERSTKILRDIWNIDEISCKFGVGLRGVLSNYLYMSKHKHIIDYGICLKRILIHKMNLSCVANAEFWMALVSGVPVK